LALISDGWANRRALHGPLAGGQLVPDDFVAELDALVADKNRRTGDQLLDLVLALSAKRAVEGLFAGCAFFLGHGDNAFNEVTP
jgi:hypothetical protein